LFNKKLTVFGHTFLEGLLELGKRGKRSRKG